ncbi:glycosyltransferase family 2 protein [Gemmatimonadota bacterium]
MICVLLSTYNGVQYVSTLLDSLIAQECSDITILIRDDGSTDGTLEILNTYAGNSDFLDVLSGSNIGVNRSFYELLEHADELGAQYIAFCDQDDLWEADKISRALTLIEEKYPERPAMYCSRLVISDEELNEISTSRPPLRGPSFRNALVENIATGATMVINRKAIELLKINRPDFDRIVMYDWWIYQAISAFGTVVFDDQSHILSRQHAGNVVGLPFGKRYWRSKAQFISTSDRYLIRTQAREFSRIFGEQLTEEDRFTLDEFLTRIQDPNFFSRLWYAFSGRVFRQRAVDNLLLRVRIVLGRI